MDNQQKNGKPSIGTIAATVIVAAAFIALAIFFVSVLLKDTSGGENEIRESEKLSAQTETGADSDREAETENAPVRRGSVKYTVVELPYSDTSKGPLILINSKHRFDFSGTGSFKTLYGNKSNNYQISGSGMKAAPVAISALNDMLDAFFSEKNLSNVLVKSAYRSLEEQQQIYDNCYEKYGENAASYVSSPGYSDHHTGLSFDLGVFSNDGAVYSLDYSNSYDWIMEHCADFGFILRFPKEKASITGISTDPFHFRYVSLPHSAAMAQLDLCLEEYIEQLSQYTFSGEHLSVEANGSEYEIYSFPASEEKEIQTVPVPENYTYTLSGDNCGNFIVAIKLS